MGIFAADRGDNSPENTTEDILKQLNKEKKSMWTKLWDNSLDILAPSIEVSSGPLLSYINLESP